MSVISNKLNGRVTLHIQEDTTLTILGDHAASDLALYGETLYGAYIRNISWACAPGAHLRVTRGGYIVGIYHSSNHMSYAAQGMPLLKAADRDLQFEFIGGSGYCVVELQKIFTPIPFIEYEDDYSFSVLEYFANGEQGVWLDPSDFSTMFQDSAGTTPVTAVGQAVGLVLDKSKGLVLGPELVTNGGFDSADGWVIGAGWAISGGKLRSDGSQANNKNCFIPASVFPGKTYEVRFTVADRNSGSVRVFNGGSGSITSFKTENGEYVERLITNSVVQSVFVQQTSNFDGTIDNISVRELPGNHATQATTASKPVLGRVPLGGRRNLLTYTEQFDNAVWIKNSTTVTPNATLAPDGTMTASRLSWSAVGNAIYSGSSQPSGVTRTRSIWIRGDVAGGSVRITNPYIGSAAITHTVTTDWVRVEAPQNHTSNFDGILLAKLDDGASSIYVWGAQLETGSTATDYQKVVSTYDVTEAGKPDLYYLAFDGVDDFLVTPTITPGTDKVQVFAGVRKLAPDGVVVEHSPASSANNGTFLVYTPDTRFRFDSKGTTNAIASGGAATAPVTAVVTGIGDIAADTAILRVNGTQASSSATDQGTGNYGDFPLYIGRRGGSTTPFNGHIYQLIVRFGANLDEAVIEQVETLTNTLTGAY